jgi:hypothetical protein
MFPEATWRSLVPHSLQFGRQSPIVSTYRLSLGSLYSQMAVPETQRVSHAASNLNSPLGMHERTEILPNPAVCGPPGPLADLPGNDRVETCMLT